MSKKNRVKNIFLAELKKVPIVQVACEKTGISRNSIYRWKREDKKFSKAVDEAIAEGEALVNDMSESQLLTLIKEKNFSAIRFWLNHRNPKFKDKMEVTSKIEDSGELTSAQAEIVQKALKLAQILPLPDKKDDK
ncbi:MAG: phBC6A51 family helix-turn-helix protein [Candidatus Komeilibacteria bacterium]